MFISFLFWNATKTQSKRRSYISNCPKIFRSLGFYNELQKKKKEKYI
jgi:hypothetical protein